MLTTQFTPGTPVWVDLATDDLDVSAAFYRAVLGWRFESAGEEAGGYGMFYAPAGIAAAMGPCTPGGEPSWTLYFHTTDAEAIEKAATGAGGTTLVPPSDVFTAGRMAHFADPHGARFAVWQPGDRGGLDVVTDPGSLAWTELVTSDAEAAQAFYAAVFAWKFYKTPMAGMEYVVVTPAGKDEGGETGGVYELSDTARDAAAPQARWYPYFEVTDCDATVRAALDSGGRVPVEPLDLDGVGRMALIADPRGALFHVITSVPAGTP